MPAMALEFAPTSIKSARCKFLNVLITHTFSLRLVRSAPTASLDPIDEVLHQLAKALRLKCMDYAPIGALSLGLGFP
jgi:hypothetical protein